MKYAPHLFSSIGPFLFQRVITCAFCLFFIVRSRRRSPLLWRDCGCKLSEEFLLVFVLQTFSFQMRDAHCRARAVLSRLQWDLWSEMLPPDLPAFSENTKLNESVEAVSVELLMLSRGDETKVTGAKQDPCWRKIGLNWHVSFPKKNQVFIVIEIQNVIAVIVCKFLGNFLRSFI